MTTASHKHKPVSAISETDAAEVLTRRARKGIPRYLVAEEINLVPYLDVMVNLIIFLLVTISTVLPLSMLSIFPLSVAAKDASQPEQPKPELNFTVFVTREGFTIAGSGGAMEPIPLAAGGEHDYARLTDTAATIKDRYPNEDMVIVSGEKDTKYDIIIQTMDALRSKGDRLLFYNVQLSPGLVNK